MFKCDKLLYITQPTDVNYSLYAQPTEHSDCYNISCKNYSHDGVSSMLSYTHNSKKSKQLTSEVTGRCACVSNNEGEV